MKLVVFSTKCYWRSKSSASGYATEGGFPFQMLALSELFDTTRLVLPFLPVENVPGEIALTGHALSLVPLSVPGGTGLKRKLGLVFWLVRNGGSILREILVADAIHTPIPSDIGTIAMLLAVALQKPLFVRHCGNWFLPRTRAERFWKWFMERYAGGKRVMLATGGAERQPSARNPHIRWIFSTTLTRAELSEYGVTRLPPTLGCIRLIIVCRQEKDKGTGVVIESLPLLLKQFREVTLDVVGDGGGLAEFKHLAHKLGVSNKVVFYGKVNHTRVIQLLEAADVFAFPTAASEGFPKAVLEALACGLPVVTTPVSVLPQLIGTGCGVLIAQPTPVLLAAGIQGCVASSDAYRAMSMRATKTAQEYSLEGWRDTIGSSLEKAWGPLRSNG